jgi:UDP-N-acetylglucosamine diphosphorylase / glucose-1-phosphate thymidylyltransferase / UDP-N-acetylgalactosamine diphosphorylase / glucosamine-1-phosphate N-acetyltransferase / galactosamine-1-phosphate N-acetyltransferase
MKQVLYLFDDERASEWYPFSWTRPLGEILCGTLLQRDRLQRVTGARMAAYLGPSELEGFEEPGGTPPVRTVSARESGTEAGNGPLQVILLSRYLPPSEGIPPELWDRATRSAERTGVRLVAGGVTVGWILPPGTPLPPPSTLALPDGNPGDDGWEGTTEEDRPVVELPGLVLPDPWTLMSLNTDRIREDLAAGVQGRARSLTELPGVHVLGDGGVTVEEGVTVDPGSILDVREGPIHLARGVHVESATRLTGPAYIGAGSRLLGGRIAHLSCGPVCKLHGEIDTAVVLGYANKAHDGYLGHSILGRWVNLGAMTTNSDLKNTYGTVRMPAPDGSRMVETELLKVGVFLGDHVRTGIGTLMNTGSLVGPGSNLFGGAMPPRYVAPFSWGVGEELGVYRKDAFLTTARRVMARREVPLGPGMERVLARAWDRARGEEAAR